MGYRVRLASNGAGDELWWRCSACPVLSWWRDGRCEACKKPLAELPVFRLGTEHFDAYFRACAVIARKKPRMPLNGLRCPSCASELIDVYGRNEERAGVAGYALWVHCPDCGLDVPTEPDWISRI